MGENDFSGVWALVATAGGKFIGQCKGTSHEDIIGKIEQSSNGWIHLSDTYEYTSALMPVQGPQGPGMQRAIHCLPIGATSNAVTIWVKPVSILFFEEMQAEDRNEYKNLVTRARQLAIQSRAQKAGISLAGLQVPEEFNPNKIKRG